MADRQQIEFVIRADGAVEEKVTGVSGPDCEAVTQAIEKALGQVTNRTRTPDYWQSQQSSETVTTSS